MTLRLSEARHEERESCVQERVSVKSVSSSDEEKVRANKNIQRKINNCIMPFSNQSKPGRIPRRESGYKSDGEPEKVEKSLHINSIHRVFSIISG